MTYNLEAKEFVPSWLKNSKPSDQVKQCKKTPPMLPTTMLLPPGQQALLNPNPQLSSPSGSTTTTSVSYPSWKPPPPSSSPAKTPLLSPTATVFSRSRAILQGILLPLTDDEAIAISQRSKLKAAARDFVPGQLVYSRNTPKLSPLILPAQPDDDPDMLLSDSWCLYYLPPGGTASEETFDPTLVFRIDSVATFWRTFNHLPCASMLPLRSTMYLFRDDIIPKWEDKKNINGGLWRIKVPENCVDDVWLFTACRTIGESWSKSNRNSVNGIVFKVREKGLVVEVWVEQKHQEFVADWQSAIVDVLPSFTIDYYMHKDVQQFTKNVQQASPKTGIKKKRK